MQAKVADMYAARASACGWAYAVARSGDAGRSDRFDAAAAILRASVNAVRAALEAIKAPGGASCTTDRPVESHLRDAELLDFGAGTKEIRGMLIGHNRPWSSERFRRRTRPGLVTALWMPPSRPTPKPA
jgi:isovaleryl-CoA dehydrogenase